MNNVQFGKFDAALKANIIVTDELIARLYGIGGDNVLLLPRGEQAKSFQNVQDLCRAFLQRGLSPSDAVAAVGGGSIGDAVGFACSVYKRGVGLIHVPTTLVAMVDSSIGGKTAIDLDGVKNAVGTYFFADTLIDVNFLSTLDETQMLSGRGEICKYRMLSEEVDRVCQNNGALESVIAACARFKGEICAADPYCRGVRNKLNFGHTVGHAMELSLGLPHGIAVANGLYYETELAFRLGLCTEAYAEAWKREISEFPIYPLSAEMFAPMLQDKKNTRLGVGFVLPPSFEVVYLPCQKAAELLGVTAFGKTRS